jgi:hypothetical protein
MSQAQAFPMRALATAAVRRLPRRVRSAIRRRAAADARLVAAEAERRTREALHAHATDLLAAGRPLDDVLAELMAA